MADLADAFARVSSAAVRASLADAKPDVFWTDRPDRPAPRPNLTGGGHRADLLIVGGGYTGLWAAIQAKEDDPTREVIVVERGRIGVAASGRNGGFVSPSLTHGTAQGKSLWPHELDLLMDIGDRNFAQLVIALRRYGVDADFHLPGQLQTALSTQQVGSLNETFDTELAAGRRLTWLDEEQVRARVRSPLYRAGVFDREVGLIDPGRLVWGLAAAAESLGVKVFEDTAVTGLTTDGTGVRVSTEWGSVQAERVVLGTNAFPMLKQANRYVLPVYDHVLMSEPLSADQLAEIGWQGREGLTDSGNQFHYYRRTLDDRILFGGYDANYHFGGSIDPRFEQSESHDLLARHFLAIFPQLTGITFTHRWAGVIGTTSRFTPVFGTAERGRVAYALGYTGLGVAASRFGARVALDLVDGRTTRATELAMVRTKPMPFPPEPVRWAAVATTRRALAREDETGERGRWLTLLDRFGVGFDS